MKHIVSITEFDKEVNLYKTTPFYLKKSSGYQAGFKDAIFLARQIIEESKREE